MAKLQYGPIVTSASGKVAGVVFSIWKGVQYVKRWVKPTYTNTATQILIRDAFKMLCQLWKYLPSSVVLAWTNYAKGKGMANRNAWIGQNVVMAASAHIGIMTPHNPAFFPPDPITVTHGTAGMVKLHFVWPAGYTTNDKCYSAIVRKKSPTYVWAGSVTFPATQIETVGLAATSHYAHWYLAATISHQRSMSYGYAVTIT